jgi:hypothetical protein
MVLVTRSARKATRIVNANVKAMSRKAHRAHRRLINKKLSILIDEINSYCLELDEIDVNNQPMRKHMVTCWEVA